MAQSEILTESTIRHQVYLEGLKGGEVNQFAAFLNNIDQTIRRRLSGDELTSFSRKRLEAILFSVDQALDKIFSKHYTQLAGNLIDLSRYESEFEARNLNNSLASYEAVVPAATQVRAAVFSHPLSVRGSDGGKLLQPFIEDWSNNEKKRLTNAIRQGVFEGQTNAQIIRNIRGTKARNYRDGLLTITNRNASAIVRTSVQHVASVARFETWKDNSDVVVGYRWVSTLDGRTSQVCRSLDSRVFKVGKGPVPPIHINCRSTTVAELDGRYSILSKGRKRASKDGQVSDQNFYDWLKKQPANFQNDVLGISRGKLFRNGGLTSDQFSRLNLNRNFKPLTLNEMREKEPLAFEKADI